MPLRLPCMAENIFCQESAAGFEKKGYMQARSYSWLAALLAFIACAPHGAMAQVLTTFRYEYQAQRHCPVDTVVWLDFRRNRYYLKTQSRYSSGYDTGSFVCRNEARNSGYRRSPLGLR